MNKKIVFITAFSAVLIAGCGSPSSPPPTLTQVAADHGATGLTPIEPTLYAAHEGTASWHGRSVDIAVFDNDALRDRWIEAATQFGAVLSKGHDWVILGN